MRRVTATDRFQDNGRCLGQGGADLAEVGPWIDDPVASQTPAQGVAEGQVERGADLDLDDSGSYRSLKILPCHRCAQLQDERNPELLAQPRNAGDFRRYTERPLGRVDHRDIERVNVGSCHEVGRELLRRVGELAG